MNALLTAICGLILLVVLVVIHELGHFIAARAFGVRVTEFMIGLPGPSIGFERNGTRFGVTAVPLGGYNRITGMEGGPENPNLEQVLAYVYRHGTADAEHVALACGITEEEAEEALMILDEWGSINAPGRSNKLDVYAAPKTDALALGAPREVEDPKALLDSERAQTYRALSWWKRVIVLLAGPFMNLILALLVFLLVFCVIGLPMTTNTISSVSEGGPAYTAGLQAEDTITAVDSTETPDWTTLATTISSLSVGQTVDISYLRDGTTQHAQLVVGQSEAGAPYLGVFAGTTQYRMSVGEALETTWSYLVTTVQAYAKLFNPVTVSETVDQSTSVVGIAVMTQRAAALGIVPLLFILAIVSLSLGIVNLLPVPPLDGGKIIVEIIQGITKRDIPVRVISTISFVVIALLLVLFVVLLRQDIIRFVLGG